MGMQMLLTMIRMRFSIRSLNAMVGARKDQQWIVVIVGA